MCSIPNTAASRFPPDWVCRGRDETEAESVARPPQLAASSYVVSRNCNWPASPITAEACPSFRSSFTAQQLPCAFNATSPNRYQTRKPTRRLSVWRARKSTWCTRLLVVLSGGAEGIGRLSWRPLSFSETGMTRILWMSACRFLLVATADLSPDIPEGPVTRSGTATGSLIGIAVVSR
jgi:hypothetical protein